MQLQEDEFSYRKKSGTGTNKKKIAIYAAVITILIIILIVIIAAIVKKKVFPAPPPITWNKRLPDWQIPRNYNLSIYLDPASMTLSGVEVIDVVISNLTTNIILLHQHNLTVDKAEIRFVEQFLDYSSDFGYMKADQLSYDNVNNILGLKFNKLKDEQPKENGLKLVQLRLTWRAGLTANQDQGVIVSSYTSGDTTNYFASTNFKMFARSAFPCFDEPKYRTNFTLTLTTKTGYDTILSNTPLISQKTNKGVTISNFQTTPRMPTNSLGFFVGSFRPIKSSVDSTDIMLYGTNEKLAVAQTTLSKITTFVNYYNQYFNIPLPNPKLDIVALPDFTPSGSVDHVSAWGLIFVSDSVISDKYSSVYDVQTNALTLAREISEQWLGNYVNVKWWNSLWLKEGISHFFQYLCVDSIYPEWDVFRLFQIDIQQVGFVADALVDLPLEPAESNIVSERDVKIMFESNIVTNKGASIAYMLYNRLEAIETNLFQAGIQIYLSTFAYNSANSLDFLQVVDTSTSFPVPGYLGNWVFKQGYPVVSLLSQNGTHFTIQQQKYNSFTQSNDFSTVWWVSVTYQIDNYLAAPVYSRLNQTTKVETIPTVPDNNYFILNPDRVGFYKVFYTPSKLTEITNLVASPNSTDLFSPEDLSGILFDLYSMMRSGNRTVSYSVDQVFNFSLKMKPLKSFVVWYNLRKIYSSVSTMIEFITGTSAKYQSYMRYLLQDIYQTVGWVEQSTDTDQIKMTRHHVLQMAVNFNVSGAVNNGLTFFRQIKSVNSLYTYNPNIIDAVLIAGAKYGDSSDWDWLKDQYINSPSPVVSRRILNAMARTVDQNTLLKAFQFSVNTSEIRVDDIIPFLDQLSQYHLQQTWDFFLAEWDVYHSIFASHDIDELDELIVAVSRRLLLQTQLDSFNSFLKTKFANEMDSYLILNNIQTINTNIQCLSVCSAPLTLWLNNWNANKKMSSEDVESNIIFN